MRRLLLLFLLLAALPAHAADEAEQARMLKELFRRPFPEWREVMQQNRSLLDDSFFERVEKRIRWSRDHGQVDDAVRFGIVGDLAAGVVGRPPRFREAHWRLDFPQGTREAWPADLPVRVGGEAPVDVRAAWRRGLHTVLDLTVTNRTREPVLDYALTLTVGTQEFVLRHPRACDPLAAGETRHVAHLADVLDPSGDRGWVWPGQPPGPEVQVKAVLFTDSMWRSDPPGDLTAPVEAP